VGLLNSSLYAYLNLLTGSSSGIEREQGVSADIFNYPVIIDERLAKLVDRIQETYRLESKNILNNLSKIEGLLRELDMLVMEKFGLKKDVFVDYALKVQIPLLAKKRSTWEKVTSQQLHEYANVFTDYFSTIFANNQKYIATRIYTDVAYHYSVVEFVFLNERPINLVTELRGNRGSQLSLISKFSVEKINDLFYQIRDVISFKDNSFFIIKTDECKNWHPAMAKLDLADVLDSILSRNEVD
jgi:hypothetical protein